MTNEQARQAAAKYPHLNDKYFAFYAGRNAAKFGHKCEFTDPTLKTEWLRGYREAQREHALDMDTEWDGA
jgi:ribosome modulation factor